MNGKTILIPIFVLLLAIMVIPISAEPIQNGQCVELNSTVDISPIGWGLTHIVYYGRYVDEFSPIPDDISVVKTYPMPSSLNLLKNFWIDPELFGDSLGYWYQGYGNKKWNDRAANNRLFYVSTNCTQPKKEQVNITEQILENTSIPKKMDYLPEKFESDILIARGYESMPMDVDANSKWWLIGNSFSMYDQSPQDGYLSISPDITEQMEPGEYHLYVISPGENGIMEVRYEENHDINPVLISDIRGTNPIPILQTDTPKNVEDKLRAMIGRSRDDTHKIYKISVMDPEIQIGRIDALTGMDKSWYNIRGYTTMNNGTILKIQIDKEKINAITKPIREWTTNTDGVYLGAWRKFNTMVPVDYKQINPGPHEITISANGVEISVPIYIHREQDPHYTPPEYTEYFGTSPFVTPKIIEREVPGPVQIKTVTVTITPSEEQIYKAQEKVITNHIWEWIFAIMVIMGGIRGMIYLIRYLVSVYRRAKL